MGMGLRLCKCYYVKYEIYFNKRCVFLHKKSIFLTFKLFHYIWKILIYNGEIYTFERRIVIFHCIRECSIIMCTLCLKKCWTDLDVSQSTVPKGYMKFCPMYWSTIIFGYWPNAEHCIFKDCFFFDMHFNDVLLFY